MRSSETGSGPTTSMPEEFELTIASWDTASTLEESSDWSVGTVWGAIGQEYYLLDVVRGRFESPELRRRIAEAFAAITGSMRP